MNAPHIAERPTAPTRADRHRLAHIMGQGFDYDVNAVTWQDVLARGLAFDLARWIEDEVDVDRLYRLGLCDEARRADQAHYELLEFAERMDPETREREQDAWNAYEAVRTG